MNEPLSLLGDAPVIFLTNRFNLLHVLSAGFVPTREGFWKYYDDLLAKAPGRVVLFAGPVSPSVSAVVESAAAAFPVAVEVPRPTERGARSSTLTTAGGPDVVVWAPEGDWPLPARTVVHFRTEEERREFEARSFQNVRTPDELRVTPDLFSDGALEAGDLSSWLASLPARATATSPALADKTLGGVALAVEMRARSAGETDALALIDDLVGAHDGADALAAFVSAPLPQAELEATVFRVACRLMVEVDPEEGYAPLSLIALLGGELQQSLGDGEAAEMVRVHLERAEAVLRAEDEMRPLRAGHGLVSMKAVLLAVLRRDADRLFRTVADDAPGDVALHEAAAYLVGLAQGRIRTALEFRRPSIDRRLVEISLGRPDASDSSNPPATILERVRALDLVDSAGRHALARLCVVFGWTDIVHTVVFGAAATLEPAKVGRSNGVRVVVSGAVEPDYEIDLDAFRERLGDLDAAALERPDVRKALLLEPVVKRRRAGKTKS
jgi:hypothetical protein